MSTGLSTEALGAVGGGAGAPLDRTVGGVGGTLGGWWRWLNRELLFDRNSIIHIGILAATALAVARLGWIGILLYPVVMITIEILHYAFKISLFDTETVIQHGYNLSRHISDNLHSGGLDYGFNFYDGDFTKTRQQAQEDKFRYAFARLGLRPGMSLIDVGCGCGDWLDWLRRQGVRVAGINITAGQAHECRERGLEVHCANWKDVAADPELAKQLFGRFDVVTFWDTVEHYVPSRYLNRVGERDRIYGAMFELAKKLMRDPNSGRIWISCLHRKDPGKETLPEFLRRRTYCYLLDKYHSGLYPQASRDELVLNARRAGLSLVHRRDTTLDYLMTSRLEAAHFGRHHFELTARRALVLLWELIVDPSWFQALLWFKLEIWMWQFQSDDVEKSDVVNWWLVFDGAPAVRA